MEKAELGSRIREARSKKGLTQEVLSERAGIGITYLGEIERGVKMPSIRILINIVNALDVSADYILRNEVNSGKQYVFDEITKKLEKLTPKQRMAAGALLDAYISHLE